MVDIPLTAPAADRNKDAILAVLRKLLPKKGLVLEVGSGTGQHAIHFARALRNLVWQPSDPDRTMRESIRGWMAEAELGNLREPLDIDVRAETWPLERADAVVSINMIHIAPLAATPALLAGAARVLAPSGRLLLYGPFRRPDRPLVPTNEAFDAMLRSQNLDWGLRDLNMVQDWAGRQGLALADIVDMPANNLMVVFERTTAEAARPPSVLEPAKPSPLTTKPLASAKADESGKPSLAPGPAEAALLRGAEPKAEASTRAASTSAEPSPRQPEFRPWMAPPPPRAAQTSPSASPAPPAATEGVKRLAANRPTEPPKPVEQPKPVEPPKWIFPPRLSEPPKTMDGFKPAEPRRAAEAAKPIAPPKPPERIPLPEWPKPSPPPDLDYPKLVELPKWHYPTRDDDRPVAKAPPPPAIRYRDELPAEPEPFDEWSDPAPTFKPEKRLDPVIPSKPTKGIAEDLLRWLVRDPNLATSNGAGRGAPPKRQGVSLMITQRQRAQLLELGFSEQDIRTMTPSEAHDILGRR